jgi:hypothetical protein
MAATPEPSPDGMSAGEALVSQGATIMRVEHDSMLAISKQRPRDHEKILRAVLKEIDLVPAQASRGYYSIPYNDGDRTTYVTGHSIYLARILFRNWGNSAVRSYVASETDDKVFLSAVFTDLEENSRTERPFVVSKWQKRKGRMVLLEGQWLMQAIQAGASKAERNAITAGIPDWLTQSAYEQIRRIAADEVKQNLSAIVEGFMRQGVTRERLEKHLGKPLEKLGNEELADLRGTFNALRDKEQTPESIGADPDEPQEASTVEQVLKSATTASSESAPNDGATGRASSPPEREPGSGPATAGSQVEADPAGGSARQPGQSPTPLTAQASADDDGQRKFGGF